MKNLKLIALLMAAGVIFASCSKDNSDDNTNTDDKTASLTVGISFSPEGRVAGPAPTGDQLVNNFTAFVFDASGRSTATPKSTTGQSSVVFSNVSTTSKYVYIVANADATSTTALTALADRNALEAYLLDLKLGSAASQTATSVWATGVGEISRFNDDSGTMKATVNVTLDFVPAKVILNSIVVNDSAPIADKRTFTIDNVRIINGAAKTKLFGTSLVPATADFAFYSGMNVTGLPYVSTTIPHSVNTNLSDAYDNTNGHYFYVFENNQADYPTILSIETTVGDAPDQTTRYFNYHFAPYDADGEYIARGQQYEVTMSLNINTKTDPGTDGPTDPSIDGEITVNVIPASWTVKGINKVFNH